MKSNRNKKINALEFMIRYKKIIIVVTLVITLVAIILPIFICKKHPIVLNNSSRLQIVESVSQIIGVAFVCISAVIALLQYYITTQSSIKQMETDRVERAIKLANYYKNEVLTPYLTVRIIYENTGILEKLLSKKKDMHDFDCKELYELFTEGEIKQIKEIIDSKDFLLTVAKVNERYNLNLLGCQTNITTEDGQKKIKGSIEPEKALNDFYINYVSTLLNNLEYFAMYFTHNIADESVVYQSLYSTYIEICRILYYDIARVSKNGGPKLYRNIVELYEIWVSRVNETQFNINKQQNIKGTTLTNIR